MKRFKLADGNEIRGFMIRLYPDAETEAALLDIEEQLRSAWNWMISQTEDVISAREAYAVKNGLVPPRPQRPVYDSLEPNQAHQAKLSYQEQMSQWRQAVHTATNNVPCCAYRHLRDVIEHYGFRHDYQLLERVLKLRFDERDRRPCASALQALVKNYFTKSGRRKRFRRSIDRMPLQVRSGTCFELGDFGTRRGSKFYDCQIKFNGLRIRGRLPGKPPEGRVLEGVSIRQLADGWWASIKQEVPIRVPPPAVPGSIVGIDVGLDCLVAMDDGTRIYNPRGKAYAERIAGRQALNKPVGRLQLAASRNTRHLIYNQVIKKLSSVEEIRVERLPKHIGQMGSSKVSAMRTVVSMIKGRYGNRVREVDPRFTSQDCSQCGERSKESWGYDNGPYGECVACGYRAHRDVNAARNIAARDSFPLDD